MKRLFVLLALLLALSAAFAADCATTLDRLERADLSYNVLESGDADATFVLVANYPKECLIQRFLESTDQNLEGFEIEISSSELDCPYEFIEDYVGNELGDFGEALVCATSFAGDENTIRMNFTGTAAQFAQRTGNQFSVSMGGGYFFANAPADSSLTIDLPAEAAVKNHLPRSGEKTGERIYWSPLPAEAVKIDYELDAPAANGFSGDYGQMLPIIVGVLAAIAFLIVAFGILSLKRKGKAPQEPKQNLEDDVKMLKEKMRSLEQSYLKGQMEPTTYQRLMEQYQLQLNEIRVQMKKQKK